MGGRTQYSPEQDAIIVEGWTAGWPRAVLLARVNAVPGRVCDRIKNISDRAGALHVLRPEWFKAECKRQEMTKRWAARRARAPAPVAPVAPAPKLDPPKPVRVPLSELIRLGRGLGLTVSDSMDVVAVSKAQKLDDPSHPGFALLPRPSLKWPGDSGLSP